MESCFFPICVWGWQKLAHTDTCNMGSSTTRIIICHVYALGLNPSRHTCLPIPHTHWAYLHLCNPISAFPKPSPSLYLHALPLCFEKGMFTPLSKVFLWMIRLTRNLTQDSPGNTILSTILSYSLTSYSQERTEGTAGREEITGVMKAGLLSNRRPWS